MNQSKRALLASGAVERLWCQDEMQQQMAEDAGAAGGDGGGAGGAGDGSGGGSGDAGSAGTGTGNGAGAGGDAGAGKVTFTPEQQKHLDRIINDATARIKASAEDDARKTVEAERQKAEAKANQKRLEEAGEWQKIADARGEEIKAKDTEIGTLKARAEDRDTLAALVNGNIDTETKPWPKEVRALDPGPDKIHERLAWVANSRALAQKLLTLAPPEGDLGRRGGGGGNEYDRIRQEAEEKQKQRAQEGGTLSDKLARRGLAGAR